MYQSPQIHHLTHCHSLLLHRPLLVAERQEAEVSHLLAVYCSIPAVFLTQSLLHLVVIVVAVAVVLMHRPSVDLAKLFLRYLVAAKEQSQAILL